MIPFVKNESGCIEIQLVDSAGGCRRPRDHGWTASKEIQRGETKRAKVWSEGEVAELIYCYFLSKPEVRNYRKRMHSIWIERGNDAGMSEQHLADQRAAVMRKKRVSTEKLEQLRKTAIEIGSRQRSYATNSHPEQVETAAIGADEDSDAEIVQLRERIVTVRQHLEEQRCILPPLNKVNRQKLATVVQKANLAVSRINTCNVTETNEIMYATAWVVTEELGLKICLNSPRQKEAAKSPPWKLRLERKIFGLRKDLSRLEWVKCGKTGKASVDDRLKNKYNLRNKTVEESCEELKQLITATAKKIERYDRRIRQFQQNRMYYRDQKRLFQELSKKDCKDKETSPDKDEVVAFWRNLWDSPIGHAVEAPWIGKVERSWRAVSAQREFKISVTMLCKQVRKMKSWKAAGPDGVHAFWLKQLTTLHERLAMQLQATMDEGVADWLTKGRTVLIMKDKEKRAVADNYRPITCLPTTWKLLTSVISEEIYKHLEENNLMTFEQKGCRKAVRGTKDQLLIDKMVLKDCKERKVALHAAWIDYKKAFDSVPHSWLIKSLEMVKVSRTVIEFMKDAMGKWKTELTVNGENIGLCNIRRGIFQGDSLSPLWFVIALMPLSKMLQNTGKGYQLRNGTKVSHLLFMDDLKLYGKSEAEAKLLAGTVHDFSRDIRMEFGLAKCASIAMKRGKMQNSEGIVLPDNQVISGLTTDQTYKYLGILEADGIKQEAMKSKVKQEYFKRVRKVLRSDLNAGNTISAINVWAVSSFRYSAGIIDWNKTELKEADAKTRKLMTMHKTHHPRASVARLYLPREEGGRGLKSLEQTVEEEKRGIVDYLQKSKEELLSCVRQVGIVKDNGLLGDYRKEMQDARATEWREKPLHGQYIRDTERVTKLHDTFLWMKAGRLKKETEGLIIAAQDQALRTNTIKVNIDKQGGSPLCRLCGEKQETVEHLICSCAKIAQTDYKGRHDRVATSLHWSLCGQLGFSRAERWYDHRAEKVLENETHKLLWDFDIKTDKVISARRPDLLLVDKANRTAVIVDVAVPGDSRVKAKEEEKKDKYQDLAIEIQRLWELRKVKVLPIVVGALGAITSDLSKNLQALKINEVSLEQLQRTALLGTAHILRRYLSW